MKSETLTAVGFSALLNETPDRAAVPQAPDLAVLLKDYKGRAAISQGEDFDPSPSNIEQQTIRGQLANGMKYALLPKKTRGGEITATLTFRYGTLERRWSSWRSRVVAIRQKAPSPLALPAHSKVTGSSPKHRQLWVHRWSGGASRHSPRWGGAAVPLSSPSVNCQVSPVWLWPSHFGHWNLFRSSLFEFQMQD
jgi:hypothetical protein